MSVQFSDLARSVASDGVVSPQELLSLRRNAWPDGRISQDEAEALFALNGQLSEQSEEWTDFFVEALGEYLVNQRTPSGYVDAENADWLMTQIDADGELGSMAELELLVRVFERAKNVPVSLKTYAERQIENAVLEGIGPTRDGCALEKGNVNAAEARLLRRAIFAPASERPAAVGRGEAEMLFRLKDATLGAANAPEWKQLFVQGVANYLQGYADPNAQISRERAQELQAFMSDTNHGVGGFLGRMARSIPSIFANLANSAQTQGVSRDDAVASAHEVTQDEQSWLDGKVSADGKVDEYEQALLDFLAEEW